jgi:hypothetical protein
MYYSSYTKFINAYYYSWNLLFQMNPQPQCLKYYRSYANLKIRVTNSTLYRSRRHVKKCYLVHSTKVGIEGQFPSLYHPTYTACEIRNMLTTNSMQGQVQCCHIQGRRRKRESGPQNLWQLITSSPINTIKMYPNRYA